MDRGGVFEPMPPPAIAPACPDAEDSDPRVRCDDCLHAQGWRCAAHPRSGLPSRVIGGIRDLLQHCPAFEPRPVDDPCDDLAA